MENILFIVTRKIEISAPCIEQETTEYIYVLIFIFGIFTETFLRSRRNLIRRYFIENKNTIESINVLSTQYTMYFNALILAFVAKLKT